MQPDLSPEKIGQTEKETRESAKRRGVPRKVTVEILKFTLLMLILSPICLWQFSRYLLFFPDKNKYEMTSAQDELKKAFGATIEDVFIPTEKGRKLHGLYYQLPNSRHTFLLSHGNAGNLQHRILLVATLLKTGASVLVYDYQGYGQSEGEPTISGICKDGNAVYAYLTQKKGLKPDEVVLYGESLGCAVSCEIARNHPVAGLIMQSGFASLIGTAKDKLIWLHMWPSVTFPTPHLDNVSYVRGKHPPLLVIHGVHDDTLPYRYGEQIFSQASEPKTMITLPDCGHNDICLKNLDVYLNGVKDFLSTLPQN